MKKFLFAVSVIALTGFSSAAFAQCCAPAKQSPHLMLVSDLTTAVEADADADAHVSTPAADVSADVVIDTSAESATVVDAAAANAELSTLAKAIAAADLGDTLKGAGPYTVFAPTNAAFDALPAGTLDDLLRPENKEKLQNVLKHHVVEGKITASDIVEGATDVKAVNGGTLKVEKTGSDVTVGGAHVTQADVDASNGVVHVIDKVIVE